LAMAVMKCVKYKATSSVQKTTAPCQLASCIKMSYWAWITFLNFKGKTKPKCILSLSLLQVYWAWSIGKNRLSLNSLQSIVNLSFRTRTKMVF
jgi:hypothetical protein